MRISRPWMLKSLLAALAICSATSARAAAIVTQDYTNSIDGGNNPTVQAAELAAAGLASNTDLLQGVAGTYANWNLTGNFNPANLNNGSFGATSADGSLPNDIAFAQANGSNSTATYVLGAGPSGTGYTINSIRSLAGWRDAGLIQQSYDVEVRPLGGAFSLLKSVRVNAADVSIADYDDGANGGGSSVVTITENGSGILASGIDAIRFTARELAVASNFQSGSGSGTTFREIDVFGRPTVPEPGSILLAALAALGLTVTRGWRRR